MWVCAARRRQLYPLQAPRNARRSSRIKVGFAEPRFKSTGTCPTTQVREIQPAHPRHQATHPACDRPPLVDPAGGSHAARLGALIRLDSVRAFGDSVRRKGRYRPAARNLDAERNGATVWSCKFQKED